ncbi:MAG: YidC/Oxa1 family membrane protein insertase [Thermomicrobiales bacterium]
MHVDFLGAHINLALTMLSIPIWDNYVQFLEHVLDFLAQRLNSAGLAIIVFTIIVKTLLLPLTVQSIRSSKAMQEIQPKVKELQKKYGKDRQRLSQETMKLYSQHRVNPVSGCLPMIIQIPIFFGLYRAIRHLSNGTGIPDVSPLWSGPFLWLHSLAEPDPYHILPVLAGVFQFIQTKMMRPQGQQAVTDPQQKMMNQMMTFMPLLVVIFGWNFASGPVIYWVTQSVYSVVQQWFITGWGSLHDWVPGLPELPEHRRLGYRAPRDLDEIVVMSGEDGVVKQPGIMGWFQSKMQEQTEQARQRRDAPTAPIDADEIDESSEIEESADGVVTTGRSTKSTSYQARVDAATKRPATTNRSAKSSSPSQRPTAKSTTRKSGTTTTGGQNGSGQAPAVPRKSRPPKKQQSE